MRVAIHQPNYAPWCGYFAKMRACDVFVFLDDAQMPGGTSYVYRTQVLGPKSPQWLSIPTRRSLDDEIRTVGFADPRWPRKHEGTLRALYGRAPYFREIWETAEALYRDPGLSIAEFNMRLVRQIAAYLRLPCRFEVSSALQAEGEGDDRLISLVGRVGGRVYLSGKGGQNYQDPKKFHAAAIELQVHEYTPIPYPQTSPGFQAGLSIFDALFNLGQEANDLLVYSH
jgi:hypothetical protein